MKSYQSHTLRASHTVEAALLMGIIVPLLVGILYMGFFLHDRSFLQCAAHEAASLASLRADEEAFDVSSTARTLIEGRMLGTQTLSADTAASRRKVQVNYEGNFLVPGLSLPFFGQDSLSARAKVTLTLERPSKRIQKIRGAAKIIQTIRRKRE